MNQNSYVAFANAKANAFNAFVAWLGSGLGPVYIFSGWEKYNDWPLYVGVGLTLYAIFSIKNGFKALSKGVRSDFVVYSVIPILIAIVTVILMWVYNV